MNKSIHSFLVMIGIFFLNSIIAETAPTPHVISFFMVPCASNPACVKKFPADKLPTMVASHDKINNMILQRHLTSPLVQGIYVNYLGYLTYTDYQGQILLPNKESGNSLTVVITSQIYPVLFQGNTVHHFEIPQEVDAAFYEYTLKQDEQHKKWYWNIMHKERPKNSQVPTHALTIMAKPKDIEIMTGTYEAIAEPNFILPDIFVHTSIDNPFCVLKFLKVNRFFKPVEIEKKVDTQSFAQAIKA
ncbi:MAG: hypothetical protein K2X90_04520 [Candidatus Babeliaceae bacterium]|nr:hypothetical protein [Candidatus Babeliaceae bacterium]